MFDGLRLTNFRSLRDTGMINLKPITLFLGQNSSGKSTLLRTLPLIRQSIGTRSSSPILWYGDFVDFGSFDEVISTFSTQSTIGLSFHISKMQVASPYYPYAIRDRNILYDLTLTIELGVLDGSTQLKAFRVEIGDDEVNVEVDAKGYPSLITVNKKDFTKSLKERVSFSLTDIVPQALVQPEKPSRTGYVVESAAYRRLTEQEIYSTFSTLFDKRVSSGSVRAIGRRLDYAPASDFRASIKNLNVDLKSWLPVQNIILNNDSNYGAEHLRSLYLLGRLPDILYSLHQSLNSGFRNLAYVGPSRATGERYYRHQELAVDQIDPQGQNLAMYLYSLPASQRDAFSAWLEENLGYAVRVGRQGGHVQVELRERGANHFHNLADMGYGFSQILPVMAQVWGKSQRRNPSSMQSSPYIAIEQPELHLHPAYQAQIADVMAAALTVQTRGTRMPKFVVETHSEALINRLGELIFDKKINADDIAIYLFHREASTDQTEITKSVFLDDGSLSDWPLGFFSSRVRR